MLPCQTPKISNQALVFLRDVKMFASQMGHFGKKFNFYNNPVAKWFGSRICVPWNLTFTCLLQFGPVFLVVKALHVTFSSVSQTNKNLTLKGT